MEDEKVDPAPEADQNEANPEDANGSGSPPKESEVPVQQYDADADPDAGPALVEGTDGMAFGEEEEKKGENIPPEVYADIEQLFEVFDEDADGYVDINELFVMMKALDVKPLEEEEEDLIKKADPDQKGVFTKAGILSIMEEKCKPQDTVEDLIEQLNILNRRKDGGSIPTPELKQYLTTMGMKFNEEEAEEFIKEGDPKSDGVVNIEAIAGRLCPEIKEAK